MASSEEAILFLGKTGLGKSSIIAKATGSNVPTAHGLLACTKTTTGFKFTSENGRSVTLVDSPGFNQLGMSDFDVFRSMTQYLKARPELHIIAMVYLDIIAPCRFDGRFKKIFQQLCGEHYYQNVVVVTTYWNGATELTRPEWVARENHFCEDKLIWGDMITKGASCLRYDDTGESSKNIIETCFRKSGPDPPHFVSELQKGVPSDNIIFPCLTNPTGRSRVQLDVEVEAEVQIIRQRAEQEYQDYLAEEERGRILSGQ